MGYSRIKPNRKGEGEEKGGFFLFLLYPWKSQTKQSSPLKIPQNWVRSFGNSKTKNEDPWKFHITFSWSPLEIPLRF